MHGWGFTCPTWAGGCGKAELKSEYWHTMWSTTPPGSVDFGDWYGTTHYYAYVDGVLVFRWDYGNPGPKTQYRYRTRSTYQEPSSAVGPTGVIPTTAVHPPERLRAEQSIVAVTVLSFRHTIFIVGAPGASGQAKRFLPVMIERLKRQLFIATAIKNMHRYTILSVGRTGVNGAQM